jgi:hypothetical protein
MIVLNNLEAKQSGFDCRAGTGKFHGKGRGNKG